MQYVEAPQKYHGDAVCVFLAGGIGNCPDWQADATRMLGNTDLAVLNPRRKHFEVSWTREASEEQIGWEHAALRRADILLFWFPGGASVQPIALFELGYWLARFDRPMVIGCSPDYPRIDDVEIQTELAHPDQAIFRSLAACVDMVEWIARNKMPKQSRTRWPS